MRTPASLLLIALAASSIAQIDEGYSKKIRELTTEPFFLTELVDHLPASVTVPTPEKFLGHIVGAPGVLTYSGQTAEYLRLLEKSSPRVKVLSMGKSEEGREMVVAVISEESNLARLDRLKEINARLGDPRKIRNEAEAEALIAETLPMYWATGGMHAPETGPPEMVMELAYRLAVGESPFLQQIRKNSIVMLTPVLDVDGRDRVVDLYRYRKANPGKAVPPLVYWGHYVAHDDNRDGMVNSLQLSKGIAKIWHEFKPQVFHDLHESVPYLYISTGTGPYNPSYDPLTIDEWHILAYNEVNEMTRRGVPGVWTHGFYDGWAPNYGFMIANGHNAIGRFYETFGSGPDTGIRSAGSTDRQWFRPNPPFPQVRWSIRNNTNLMQSALLLGLHKVATEKETFLRNYYLKAKRSVAKARAEGPAAYVIMPDANRRTEAEMLVTLLRRQEIEVAMLDGEVETADGKFPAGSYYVRMDQPYSRMADMMLDKQFYNPSDPRSYDDTGWQLGPLFDLNVVRVKDVKFLDLAKPRTAFLGVPAVATQDSYRDQWAVVSGAWGLQRLMFLERIAEMGGRIDVAEAPFEAAGRTHPTGTLLVSFDPAKGGGSPQFASSLMTAISENGGKVESIGPKPKVASHVANLPRIALVHNWIDTQDEGWWRKAFDEMGIRYSYIPVQTLRDTPSLRSRYDVILLPPGGGSAQRLVNGLPKIGEPLAWKPSKDYPHLGGPATSDDIRGGIELQGVMNLQRFVEGGGTLICVGEAVGIPIDYGLVQGVSVAEARELAAPGGVFLTQNLAKDHPVMAGYGDTLPVYFNGFSLPMLQVGGGGGGGGLRGGSPTTRPSGRGSLTDPDVIQGRPPYTPKAEPGDAPGGTQTGPQLPSPKVLLRFSTLDKLLVSGMLDGGEELAGKAALVDCPVGKGHILLFSLNPFWRMQTVGSYNLVFNAAINLPRP